MNKAQKITLGIIISIIIILGIFLTVSLGMAPKYVPPGQGPSPK
jgi:hypothetical protein